MSRRRQAAFSLVEVLLVTAILALLGAIIFAAMGPAREKARQSVCVSNLQQIYHAISMYRADYDGIDPTEGVRTTYSDLGLPSNLGLFVGENVRNEAVLYCPDFVLPPVGHPIMSYRTCFGPDEFMPEGRKFSQVTARLGGRSPLFECESHNPMFDIAVEPRWTSKRIIVLRLNGQISNLLVPLRTFYPWE